MTTNATNEGTGGPTRDPWARAEKAAGEKERRRSSPRDLRDEWRAYHLHLAESHDFLAARHRRQARDLTLSDEAGGGGRV